MNFHLPTREECQQIVKDSDAFYCSEKVIEGQRVEMYDYRLASHSDYFPEGSPSRVELRGLTFVEQPDDTWQINILLNKFFNVNQTIGWMYEDLKDKAIIRVQNKEDGSIISFVKFANGVVRAKSKMSFESPQAVMAQRLYDEGRGLKAMVKDCFENNLVPVFELCSPSNQIVLEYEYEDLILLQVRRSTGEYLQVNDFINCPIEWKVTFTKDFELVAEDGVSILDNLLDVKAYSKEPIEGWVVTFEDGQMAKIKTDKYLQLHGLIGPDAFRENLLIETILNGNIDDVISALTPGKKKEDIESLATLMDSHFNSLVVQFKELRRKYFQDFNENRKEFAIKHKGNPLFPSVMGTIRTSFRDVEEVAEKAVKQLVLKQCNTLTNAREYIEGLK